MSGSNPYRYGNKWWYRRPLMLSKHGYTIQQEMHYGPYDTEAEALYGLLNACIEYEGRPLPWRVILWQICRRLGLVLRVAWHVYSRGAHKGKAEAPDDGALRG